MTDELPARVPGAAVFTTRIPAVQRGVADARAQQDGRHVLDVGPAPLFDPDRAAPVDPPATLAAAAVELAGDELADELVVSGSAWFAPALPAAVLEHGTPVPARAELLAADEALYRDDVGALPRRSPLHTAVRQWLNAWAGVEMGRAPE